MGHRLTGRRKSGNAVRELLRGCAYPFPLTPIFKQQIKTVGRIFASAK